jgi:cleavage and polyadenylation specificity factor subunit 1
MQCYTELTPPTAVTHSLTLPFLSADSNNLVVAKTSLLQIFSFKTISFEIDGAAGDGGQSTRQNDLSDPRVNDDAGLESSFLGLDSALLRSERARKTKLCLVAEYTLSGTVTSLVKVKIPSSKSGGEALLVGFRDAKLSLVEWDPERPGISTVSIHYYEQDELQGSPWTTSLSDCVNYLAVDPGSRCAALKFGARNLAILPFKQGDGDEDVAMDDWDEELDGPRPADKAVSKNANGDTSEAETPYGSSFVLRMSSLDPTIIFPIHLAFLHEYREPTFGILSSALLPSASLLQERKDTLTYMVFTLDLHQKASTTILSVTGLPYDLFKVIPLPPPVGGALLVGGNEIIHIDQAGKANGIGVNMFAKQCTSFNLVDLSHLQMRLEGCTIEQLSIENGEMLLILHNGSLAILSFRMDGRSVSGLNIREISNEAGVSLLTTGPSCASAVGPNTLFLGSENADSVVLGWNRRSNQLSRRKSKLDLPEGADEAFLDDVEDEDDDADDDLYGDGPTATPAATNNQTASDSANSKLGDYIFGIHDSLINIAPIIDMTLGKSGSYSSDEEKTNHQGVTSDLELVAATGRDKAGSLAVIHKNIQPKVIGRFEFPEARGIWTMNVKKPAPKGLQVDKEKSVTNGDYGTSAQEDSLMIVSKASADSAEISDVYALTAAGFEALTGTEFEPAAGLTVEAGTLGNGMRVIQVLKSEVRSYDGSKFIPSYMISPIFLSLEAGYNNGRMFGGHSWISTHATAHVLSGELSGDTSCPIASMKAITTTMCICPLPLLLAVPRLCI